MENKTKKPSIYAKLMYIFRSKAVKNTVMLILLIASIFCMFLLDEGNYVRTKYLPMLDSNVIKDVMDLLRINSFNVGYNTWLLFFCVAFVFGMYLFGNIFGVMVVDNKAQKNAHKFKNIKKSKKFYQAMFNLTLFFISVVGIFVFYMLGAFDKLNFKTVGLLLNLVYTLIICLCFLLAIPVCLFIILFVIKFIVWLVSKVVSVIAFTSKDIMASSELSNQKVLDALNEARQKAGVVVKETKTVEQVRDNQNYGKQEDITWDIFPALTKIDNSEPLPQTVNDEVKLEELALRFQAYAIKNHRVFYELPLIRSYIAGMGVSHLVILEGLSGTGKSMLPRLFAEFTNSIAKFTPVQATWRDKTDLLGYYSEFSKIYNTTDFLSNLYGASYNDKINSLVLDEVNISRVEYYFADFLSIMEFPAKDWKVRIYNPRNGQILPKKLDEGNVVVPENVWFVGTANTDDSTFTISDKVYDRAIVIDFKEKVATIESDYNAEPINISSEKLNELFNEAITKEEYKLTDEDFAKFLKICDYMRDELDVRFGNRIMTQIEKFVPVYVALGGTKEEALDFMFARKILRKLSGAYEDYIKDRLLKLSKMITESYGKGTFKETEEIINKINRRLA